MQDSLNSLKVEADNTSPKALKWDQRYCQEDAGCPSNKKTKRQKGFISSEGRNGDAPGLHHPSNV